MSSGSYLQVGMICPFYRSDDGKSRITCESIGNSDSLSLFFKRKEDFRIQTTVFCCEHYKKCEIYRAAMEKYEEGDESA